MNVILGSGVNAFLARHFLGSSYKIIPSGLSRFYGLNPAPADNFIHASEVLRANETFIKNIVGDVADFYSCAWSYNGSIINDYDPAMAQTWSAKIFGLNVPPHFELTLKNRLKFPVYTNRVSNIYSALYHKYKHEINSNLNTANISRIADNNIYYKDGSVLNYNKCISTIPLDDLYKLLNVNDVLKGVNVTIIYLQTDRLNFEGRNQLWVVDPAIRFYKSHMVKENGYLFYFTDKIDMPGSYLNQFIDNFDLISGAYIENCLPCALPDVNRLSTHNITPVGMSAEWDCAMDFSSSLYKIIKLADGV